MRTPRRLLALVAVLSLLAAACGDDDTGAAGPGPEAQAGEEQVTGGGGTADRGGDGGDGGDGAAEDDVRQVEGAHIADVVLDGDPHVVLRSTVDHEDSVGGWYLQVTDGARLALPPSTRIPAGAELRVHPGPGDSTEEDLYVGGDPDALGDGGTVTLHDAFGGEVDSLAYGG